MTDIGESVLVSVVNSNKHLVWDSAWRSVNGYVWDFVWNSVAELITTSVEFKASVRDEVASYRIFERAYVPLGSVSEDMLKGLLK